RPAGRRYPEAMTIQPTTTRWTRSRHNGPPRFAMLVSGVLAACSLGFGPPRASAQQRRQQQARQAQQRQRQRQAQNRRAAHQHPPEFFRQLRDLPPGEQDRVLANDARFHQLPPERQQQIRDNLRRWNQLTPQQHGAMRKDEEFFQSLPVENRARVRQELSSPAWRQLPPDRRRAIIGAFRQMRGLSAADRQKFIESADTQKSLSASERDILARLGAALP
ncbi:MAG TPA: DUF3106 domain-containing protein, partial [Terriglobia bacterium]|nr:DUF3106 domain-containing protein [Terriglobia bacterium]